MTTMNFPSSPNLGDEYVFNNITYIWDDVKWVAQKSNEQNMNQLLDSHKQGISQHPISGIQGLQDELNKKQDISKVVGLIADGSIIEEGSNINGKYIRFKDGTQICYLYAPNSNCPVSTSYGSLFIGDFTWTFPIPFFDIPSIPAPAAKIGTGANWASIGGLPSKTSVIIRVFDAYSSTAQNNTYISAMAIGRWK